MAVVSVCCPSCSTVYRVDAGLLGKKGRCKQATCGTTFVLTETASGEPAASTTTQAPPAEDGLPLVWHKGQVILNLYEVKQVHEGGAMGLVYRVRHRGWNVDLAVKSPRPKYFRTEAHKANFEAEAETWVKLGLHPHTVSCYYVRRLGGLPRVFAEYVEGGSLKDWIDSGKLYEGGPDKALARILDVAIQFAWGLHHAHGQRLIHRDVKPANVMLTPSGIAKVSDFGLAKARAAAEEGMAESGRSAGGMTPAYCSPEQGNRQELTRSTDVWSWAVSVLEMFTQQHPSFGPAALDLLDMILADDAAPEHLPRMPPNLVELLRQCFQERPEARPQDMREVAMTLTAVYEHAARTAYPRQAPRPVELQADSLNNRALSLLDLGKSAEALRLLDDGLRINPQHPEAVYNSGLMRWRRGELADDTLLANLERVAQAHPGDSFRYGVFRHGIDS